MVCQVEAELAGLVEAGAEVVVDFTIAPAARTTLPFLAANGIHAVVGTTGFDDADLKAFESAFSTSNCLIAANFAIGAVLMMRFAELAAPFFETAEVIELHHDAKRDAPSGTAMTTIARMAAASDRWAPDPTEDEVVPGARGGAHPRHPGAQRAAAGRSSPTRRCCSARRARPSPSATTATTGRASCPACSWRRRPSPTSPTASPSASKGSSASDPSPNRRWLPAHGAYNHRQFRVRRPPRSRARGRGWRRCRPCRGGPRSSR